MTGGRQGGQTFSAESNVQIRPLLPRALDLSGIETNTLVETSSFQLSTSRTLAAGGRTASIQLSNFSTLAHQHFFSYCDWNGRLASLSNAVLTETREYDLLDNITNITLSLWKMLLCCRFHGRSCP